MFCYWFNEKPCIFFILKMFVVVLPFFLYLNWILFVHISHLFVRWHWYELTSFDSNWMMYVFGQIMLSLFCSMMYYYIKLMFLFISLLFFSEEMQPGRDSKYSSIFVVYNIFSIFNIVSLGKYSSNVFLHYFLGN